MICLNKADQASVRHLAYNQNPPALSAAHTTRHDFNGLANLCPLVAAGQEGSGTGAGGHGAVGSGLGAGGGGEGVHGVGVAQGRRLGLGSRQGCDAGRRDILAQSSRHEKTAAGGHGHDPLVRLQLSPLPSCRLERLWSWTIWIFSVVFFSLALTFFAPLPWLSPSASCPADSQNALVSLHHQQALHATSFISKRATCESGGADANLYNLPLHVGALVIIWTVSTVGCAFPLLAARIPGLRIPRRFFFVVRHFGTGVLIATAFVHLLPTAFISLGNPCLGKFWTTDYQPMPGAIALAAIFLVTVVEMLLHPSRRLPPAALQSAATPSPQGHMCSGTALLPFRSKKPLTGRSASVSKGLSRLDLDTQALPSPPDGDANADYETHKDNQQITSKPDESHDSADSVQGNHQTALHQQQHNTSHQDLTPELRRRKERLQCILLEMGILFHSVFIGMALSVSVGNEFVVLLVAITFHQTFEGLALGSRIAAVHWAPEGNICWQPWLMALAYGCTTPLGQAIGLATHSLYSPDSEIGLILVGVMNAISAGLLTFASLIELLSEDFLSDESWRILRGRSRVVACILVFCGAFFMSLVGAWA
ncbi:hypothetical protein CDD82_3672 [Ophiocordyceps australis]|uniref:Zinc/iron permease n=1 Tax=Ophiocordyceps australis TaxID=1399860 RepID=A0A2C5Z5H5_9HYPO|nr:hypothetical protein CDD82_3672 [Ophiocordyceps australis]